MSFSNALKWKVKVKSLSHARLLVSPWTVAYQAPPSVGFFRQEYWSGLPLPSPPIHTTIYKILLLLFAKWSPTLWDPVDCSMPDFPVTLHLPEFAQTHVHWVGDAIQTSHLLCCPIHLLPSIFPSMQVYSSELALHTRWPKYWELQLQHQSFQWIFRVDFL